MIKKILITLGVTSIILLGANFITKPVDTRDVIQFASWGSKSEVEIIKPILKDFEKENPSIKIDFMHIPQNYFQKIHLLFASNTAPDVIFINNHYLPVYANAGLLEPVQADNNFYEKSLEALSWRNTLYAVPRDISNLVVFYNRDILRKNGINSPNDNWTLKEFLNIAQKVTHNGVFGISFEEDPLFYLPYLMSFGGGILSDDLSRLIVEENASQKGIQFYADLRKRHHVAPLKAESASATMAQMFLQQKLAMHLTGRWLVPKYREEADFDWDIVPFPQGENGSIVPLDASGWAIAKSSKNKIMARKLVDFLASKENSQKFAQSGLIVPARKDVAESIYFLDNKKPRNAKAFLTAIETSKPTPVSIDYKEILDNLKGRFEKDFN